MAGKCANRFASTWVPNLSCVSPACGHYVTTIGAKTSVQDGWHWTQNSGVSSFKVPNSYRSVLRCAHNPSAVRTESDLEDAISMPLQNLRRMPRRDVPDTDCFIYSCCCHVATIGTKRGVLHSCLSPA